MDADVDPASRWRAVGAAVRACEYSVPSSPVVGGTYVDPPGIHRPRVGIWMMPNNRLAGMLDDFLLSLADDADRVLPLARRAVENIPAEIRAFGDTHQSKAILHTWLAWQAEPGTPMGQALTKHYLDTQQAIALQFRDWLVRLFSPNS